MRLFVLAMNLKIPSVEDCGYFVQQSLVLAVAEQSGAKTT